MTGGGTDRGIDITGRNVVAQVKHRAAKVGGPDMQQFVGATLSLVDSYKIFFSLSGYSKPALEVANSAGVLLFEYDTTARVRPANRYAREMLESAQRRQSAPVPPPVWTRPAGSAPASTGLETYGPPPAPVPHGNVDGNSSSGEWACCGCLLLVAGLVGVVTLLLLIIDPSGRLAGTDDPNGAFGGAALATVAGLVTLLVMWVARRSRK